LNRKSLITSIVIGTAMLLGSCATETVSRTEIPQTHRGLNQTRSYEQMQEILNSAATQSFISVSEAGLSADGQGLYLVRLNHSPAPGQWKVFLLAQQHGNEPAGKEALLTLIEYISAQPQLLPEDVDLWLMPMVNPDGAGKDQRRNGNNADLNRDHIVLQQPETQTLHRVFREIMPHVAVDCHEFARDSEDYAKNGWLEWPQIMMDCLNNPMFDKNVRAAGLRWLSDIEPHVTAAGHNFTRYFVGDVPPLNEQRYSTPELDDARNGLGNYGGLTFIIESGVKRDAANSDADLGIRVDAYLQIFLQLLYNDTHREADRAAIDRAREREVPSFIPVNYFWGSNGLQTTDFKVLDIVSGNEITVPTANFMHDMIVKKSIATPQGYIVEAEQANTYRELLKNHAIPFEEINSEKGYHVQPVRIIRVEHEWDPVYARYGGRQISEIDPATDRPFAAGSLFVPVTGKDAMRAALLLEPSTIYGLYQYEPYRNFLTREGFPPVWRVVK
jgi:hypothetical protein